MGKLSRLFLFTFCIASQLLSQDPLPSWNEGIAKKTILDFVSEVTKEGSDAYIPEEDRIVTFDEDGTLWVEQPLYVEFFYTLDALKELAKTNPKWANLEPYRTILSGNLQAISSIKEHEIVQMVAMTHAGMTVENFHQKVNSWISTTLHPRFKKPFTSLVYKPMLEVMQLFKDNDFKAYIVSGGGQEFIRSFAERVYGLKPGRIIGTAGKVKYEYIQGNPALLKIPEILFIDDKTGKPEGINLIIGQKPVAAFGNSIGDRQMLEWTQSNNTKTIELLVHHDDPVREYAYGPDSKIGTFSDDLMEEAIQRKWIVISMKNDWKVIFQD